MPALPKIDLFPQRLQQFGRGEKPADFPVLENGHGLIHDVVHVIARDLELFGGQDAFDPARIEVNEVAGTAAEIGQVLDGQAQAARAGRPDHQPGAAGRKMRVGKLAGKLLVIGLVIVPADALLGHAGGAAGFKNVERAAFEFFGHPDFGLQVPQPFILEVREFFQAAEALTSAAGFQPAFLAQSSQNGEPVSGEKCHCTISRTWASSFCWAAAADFESISDIMVQRVGVVFEPVSEKYFAIVAWLGGGVAREKRITQRIEPRPSEPRSCNR
jgi:hypothetical protein